MKKIFFAIAFVGIVSTNVFPAISPINNTTISKVWVVENGMFGIVLPDNSTYWCYGNDNYLGCKFILAAAIQAWQSGAHVDLYFVDQNGHTNELNQIVIHN